MAVYILYSDISIFSTLEQIVFITADVMNVSSEAQQALLPNICFCCAAFGQVLLLPSEIKTSLSKPVMNNVFA